MTIKLQIRVPVMCMNGFSQGDEISAAYSRLTEQYQDEIAEGPAGYDGASQNIREELVRCLWFGSHFTPEELKTDDGDRVEVLSPGWWNVEGGPDFKRAEILLEGTGRVVGDVEVHTYPAGWYEHGHHRQSEYNGVCLHVVMWESNSDRPITLEDGTSVPQLTLSRYLEEEVDELIEVVDMEGSQEAGTPPEKVSGRYCGRALENGTISASWLAALLNCAGDQRLLSRGQQIEREMEEASPDEILYVRVAEALGFKNNRMPFRQLAQILPVKTLRGLIPVDGTPEQKRRKLEAACYGVAGFLTDDCGDLDQESRVYLDRLREIYRGIPQKLKAQQMTENHWQFGGTRPVNNPARRIAALAGLYAEYLPGGLVGELNRRVRTAEAPGRRRLDTTIRDALTEVFTDIDHPYWDRRYSFGGKVLERRQSLVGRSRSRAMLVDVLLPTLYAGAMRDDDGMLADRVEKVWTRLPRRRPNRIVQRMRDVIFGDSGLAGEVVNSARRQQGLHQIHNDFCATSEGCESCVIYLAAENGDEIPV
ncbi:MAG: DUF2851 family protein [Planctomycetota bacterium]